MKRSFFKIKIFLFMAIFCLGASGPVQADDRLKNAGDVLTIALPATAAGLTLGFKDGQGTLQLGSSAALALGLNYGLKYTVDAQRPNGEDHSFPSTHATVSFMSAEFMRKRYGWEYGIPAYLAASLVAYSRVQADEHYTRDVLAGAAIGIGSSYLFARPYKGWQMQPDVGQGYYGIRLSRNW